MLALHEIWGMRNCKAVVDGKLNVIWQCHLASGWASCDLGFSHSTLLQSQALVLCAILSVPVKDGYQIIRVCPEKDDQDDERFQGQDLRVVSEMTWLVQLSKVTSTQEWPHHRLQLPEWGTVERKVLISSFWWPVIGQKEMQWRCIRGSSDWTLGVITLFSERGFLSLEQTPLRSGHGTKPVKVQAVSGWLS